MSKHITPLAAALCLSILADLTLAHEALPIPTSVVMQTVPIDAVWTADGVNTYRMDVVFDASTYPEQISGLEWRISFPDYIVFDSAAFPPLVDFFFGNLDIDSFSDPAWQVTSTSVSGRFGLTGGEIPNAPVGASGIAASYLFTVDSSAVPGPHTFDVPFVSITIYDPTLTLCGRILCAGLPESIENLPFEIVGLSPADLTGPLGIPDGCVDGTDLAVLLGAWCSAAGDADPPGDPGDPPCEGCPLGFEVADIAGAGFGPPDGCVDGNDLAMLLGEWCSLAGGNPCGTCQ